MSHQPNLFIYQTINLQEKKKEVDAKNLDFITSFDTVSQDICINKLGKHSLNQNNK